MYWPHKWADIDFFKEDDIKTSHKAPRLPKALKENWSFLMPENWKEIEYFPEYSVSDHGRVRADNSGRIMALNENQYGVVQVGLMREGQAIPTDRCHFWSPKPFSLVRTRPVWTHPSTWMGIGITIA